MEHESCVGRNHEFYAPVIYSGLRIFQYPGPHEGYIEDDEETNIYVGMHVSAFHSFNTVFRG
jgi:hypothetical protein